MQGELAMNQTVRRGSLAGWLTVERAAYGAIALLGLMLRLIGLTWFPLGPAEAAQAVEAVAAAAGRTYAVTGISPLLFSGQRALFMAVGADAALARWWPALLGGLAALLFYALRDRLTRGGALMAAFLWAISPIAVFAGRLGLGDSLAPPLALALLACLNLAARTVVHPMEAASHEQADVEGHPALICAAIACGMLVITGPSAYTVALMLLAAALWWRAELESFWSRVRTARRGVLVGGLGALILGSTFFLMTPTGLAAAGDLLGSWLFGLAPLAGEYSAWEVLRRLLISEPLLLGFAICGTVMAVRSRDRHGLFFGIATAIALLIAVGGRNRQPTDLGLVVLGLALLAGPAVAAALRSVPAWRGQLDPWLLAGLELILLATAAQCLPSALNPTSKADLVQVYTTIGIITFVMAVLLWLVYGVFGDWRTVTQVLPAVLLVVGLAWSTSQLAGLNFDRGAERKSSALLVMPDAGGLADLRSELREGTALKGSGAREARVDLVLPLSQAKSLVPVLRWELRDLPNLRVAATLPSDPAPLVITVADKAAAPAETYGGANFNVLQRWRPDDLKGSAAWVRWLLYREATVAAQPQQVVLWIDRSTSEGQKGTK